MSKSYKVIWVNESTRKLAKELSGRSGISMKDYIKLALEKTKNEKFEVKKEQKKLMWNFKI